MSAWQPISTAPKDGTPVLVFCPDATEPSVFVCDWVQFQGDPDGAWQDRWNDTGPLDVDPSHWMELPPPPVSERGTGFSDAADLDAARVIKTNVLPHAK